GKRWRRALAHDPQVTLAVALAPRVVVMVVDRVGGLGAEDAAHPLHHPLAAGGGILAGQHHRPAGAGAPPAAGGGDRGGGVDPVRAADEVEVVSRALMAEPARAEVDADPHVAVLVLEQVDVVVAGADRAELDARHLLEMADAGVLPQRAVKD